MKRPVQLPQLKIVPRKDSAGLFTLEVAIISGPITEEFSKKNKVISRTIQIRGDQTLEQLHDAIFHAFDREDAHLYEFQIGGKRPHDPKAQSYGLPEIQEMSPEPRKPQGNVTSTTLESITLEVGNRFCYWFDFGDDWWHTIKVVAIDDKIPSGKFPRVIKRVGKSPPQYVDWD